MRFGEQKDSGEVAVKLPVVKLCVRLRSSVKRVPHCILRVAHKFIADRLWIRRGYVTSQRMVKKNPHPRRPKPLRGRSRGKQRVHSRHRYSIIGGTLALLLNSQRLGWRSIGLSRLSGMLTQQRAALPFFFEGTTFLFLERLPG